MKFPFASLLAIALATPAFTQAQDAAPGIELTPIYQNLTIERPVSVVIPPDNTNRRFLVEQTGKIKILPADETAATDEDVSVFLDFSDRAMAEKDFEEGLLGLAFHPQFADNGRIFVYYTQQGPKRCVVSEMSVSADGKTADLASEKVLLEIAQPEWNHNSGNIFFGPNDGYLYICVGDGGMKNGVFMLPQKLFAWNGKVLRIDVNTTAQGKHYAVPADNPFVDVPNAAPEIWALGFRNPWGASIDPETGIFYLADVGQDLWEEINIVERGGNYGWEFREGNHEFAARQALMDALNVNKKPQRGTQFIDPIHEYSHAEGLSITGGYVYRGGAIPALEGHFLYGDWKVGTLWALKYDKDQGKTVANHVLHKPEDVANPLVQPTAFCPDENGEALVLGWKGKIFRLTEGGAVAAK